VASFRLFIALPPFQFDLRVTSLLRRSITLSIDSGR
jgi:hypothetical protein